MERTILIGVVIILLLVIADRTFELRDRFLAHGKLPSAFLQSLNTPQQMIWYSLLPERIEGHPADEQVFHHYEVLGETSITSPDTRRLVARTFRHAIASAKSDAPLCFDPRHGIRITNGTQVYDLLICFECEHVRVYTGDKKSGQTGLHGSPATLDAILKAAHVRLPKAD